jgi:glycosyltransferase involved in cell wall biosynthesis
VHNVLPHKTTFVNDITARKFLSRIVSAKIIHSASTMEEMKKYLIDTRNCNVIPIGNFIDVYPNTVSKQRARAKLKIHRDDFVFLFLGKIEPYKGIEKLINEFSKMNLSSAKLIIAGKCTDVILQKQLATYKHLPGVMIINQFIPNSDIQLYFNAADIAVYPFERVTTSSSVLLPLSFSKSIIYPRVGNLKELPDDIGYSYKIDDPNGLRNCINTAFKEKESLNILNSNAFKYAYKLSWKMIAQETTKIYSELTT